MLPFFTHRRPEVSLEEILGEFREKRDRCLILMDNPFDPSGLVFMGNVDDISLATKDGLYYVSSERAIYSVSCGEAIKVFHV